MQIAFGKWLPDQPEHNNPGANVATNVYYAINTYKRFPSLVSYSGASTVVTDSKGAASFRDSTNTVYNFVSTATNIFQLSSGAFTSRKSSLTGTATDFFTFTQFGEYIIASNGVDAAQFYLMGSSTNFAALTTIQTAGTCPLFKVSSVIRDFLVTGNITGATNRVQWSGINDITVWTGKQSDFQDLPGSGGRIVAITSGEVGYVFRQNQIVRMDYVGGITVFRFSVISPNRGAVYGRTVCQDNRRVFFYADDGFYEIQGDDVVPIGVEKVNRFFDLDLNKAFSDRICAAIDPFNQLAMWLYPSASNTSNTTGICDKVIIYNYATGNWSLGNVNASTIFSQFVGAYTVELMDIISQNLDNINAALDTDYWNGGQMFLGAIDNEFKAAIFSGNSNECEIETAEIEGFPGVKTKITGVRPIIDSSSNVIIKTRDRLADSVTSSSSVTINSTGIAPVRQSGRYFKINVKIPSGTTFTHAQGIDVIASQAGYR
jgi:hypothetical protein